MLIYVILAKWQFFNHKATPYMLAVLLFVLTVFLVPISIGALEPNSLCMDPSDLTDFTRCRQ
jgi:Ca2+/H+ antiporter